MKGFVPSSVDSLVFEKFEGNQPNADKFPNAHRWFAHIQSFGEDRKHFEVAFNRFFFPHIFLNQKAGQEDDIKLPAEISENVDNITQEHLAALDVKQIKLVRRYLVEY